MAKRRETDMRESPQTLPKKVNKSRNCLMAKSTAKNYCEVSDSNNLNLNYLRKQWNYLLKHTKIEGKVLDAGCSTGAQMLTLKELGREVCGADFDGKAVEICKGKGLEAKKWDAEKGKLPFKTDFFDSVYSFHLIEHLHKPDNFISEIKRVLKPNGTLLILTPNFEYDYKEFYHDHTHVHPYNLRGLERLLEQNGFEKYFSVGKYGHAKFLWRFGIFGNYGKAALVAAKNVK